ncbi:SAM-dependent methyltransferase [Nocardiopsis composta]|uniref:SAM-dependent methyltransferase n=2 Tax=Nocardiopsis composta TaxID=157465 RepID=A0A7W8QMX8_9ACTN|nr:SAM-dependent methyltransferase [Nocardiopsis composta]
MAAPRPYGLRYRDFAWNHNAHYHDMLLRHVPPGAERALDVGCGDGRFARRLALRGLEVDAIDPDAGILDLARERTPGRLDVHYTAAPLAGIDLEPGAYDFISAIASLHHMPFPDALRRLDAALAPGGVLAVLGLYREDTATDRAAGLAALPAQWATAAGLKAARLLTGVPDPAYLSDMRTADPEMTLHRIAAEAGRVLPGVRVRRHLYWRYSLVYVRP